MHDGEREKKPIWIIEIRLGSHYAHIYQVINYLSKQDWHLYHYTAMGNLETLYRSHQCLLNSFNSWSKSEFILFFKLRTGRPTYFCKSYSADCPQMSVFREKTKFNTYTCHTALSFLGLGTSTCLIMNWHRLL